MRRFTFFLLLAVVALSCSKKTAPAKSEPVQPAPPVAEAPKPVVTPSPVVEDANSMVAVGKTLFDGNCGKCHAFKKPELFTATNWAAIMDRMAPKARLNDDEKMQVLAYVQHNAKKS